ncbi:hypothetical protein BDN72DRAFT_838661 [Pluteus cervinus]|uniref:Uncharacterized protein n=1 Tax=Pluteus cervinus TaxID=181527 RepID=A0ACD3B044_9AGAR|nr:hypothetical protein BDN72DRAFT_838661 [Pluteus cervinus]
MSSPLTGHKCNSSDLNKVAEGARKGSPRELVFLAQNWTSFPHTFNDEVLSIFFQHLNSSDVLTDIDMDHLDIEASEQPSIASTSFLAFWSLWGILQLGYMSKTNPYEAIRAWPGIFKWSAFFFASRVQARNPNRGTSIFSGSLDRSTFIRRAMTRDVIAGVWWAIISSSSAVMKLVTETRGFLEISVGLWIHEDEYKVNDSEVSTCGGSGHEVPQVPDAIPIPLSLLECFMTHMMENGAGAPFAEKVILAVGDIDRTALRVIENIKRALKARELFYKTVSIVFRLVIHLFRAPQVQIREAIMKRGAGALCTKLLVRIASCIQESFPKRRPDLEGLLVVGFQCIVRLTDTTNGFSWIIQIMDAGILSAFVEASPVFHDLGDSEYETISKLFSTRIPTFLCYRSVVHAADTMFQNLERTERFRLLPKSRAWKVLSDLTKLTAEQKAHITLDGERFKRTLFWCSNTQCRKLDVLRHFRRCGSCLSSFYCSSECQVAHWEHGHKICCKKRSSDNRDSFRDQEYLQERNHREACKYLPHLKALVATKYPGIPLADLMVIIDYTKVPVTHTVTRVSDYAKEHPSFNPMPLDRRKLGEQTIIIGICPTGMRRSTSCRTCVTGGIWTDSLREAGEPPPKLDRTGKRLVDSVDELARTMWREYWGVKNDTRE